MRAVMLAAGVGSRLTGHDETGLPKSLLRFGGETLLQRSIANLRRLSLDSLTLVVGYRAPDIIAEVDRLDAGDFVEFVANEAYREGSVVSLWWAGGTLAGGADVLFMDADVLYHPALLDRLVDHPRADCVLMDRDFEPGDEPVKLCLRDGQPVEFRKRVAVEHDDMGEWPGFLKLSAPLAAEAARLARSYVEEGRRDQPCEEVFRELLLAHPGEFAIADVTGVPWIEIDFPEDVKRAEREILPAIEAYRG